MPRRVVIIGAGPGGLACAMLLAKAGVPVTVLERQPGVGGRTSTFTSEDGAYRFDLGPTFFLYPRVLQEIFRACGRDLFRDVPMTRLDPQYELVFGAGGRMRCTSDVARMEEEVARISPGDARHLRRFLDDNRLKLARFRPVLERPFLGLRDVLTWDMIKLLPLLRPWSSLDGELGRYFRDPRIRLAFAFQSKYLG
ncbi:MAG: FAD-dependent oxidoreductase, partial [Gemmataceae bacterium]|nr:FAD-dependent oxidoreductase [Gemmataceae bacterium]